MPASTWWELIHFERLTALYSRPPSLDRLILRSLRLSMYGPTLMVRTEFPSFPDRAPPAWTEAGCDRFEAQIHFLAVGEDLRLRGVPGHTAVDVRITRLIEEHRIRVAMRGAGFSLDFTAADSMQASHLSAYRSVDGNPSTAPRWFESRVDQKLYRVLPAVTARPFYG